jgi:hypothetical protein
LPVESGINFPSGIDLASELLLITRIAGVDEPDPEPDRTMPAVSPTPLLPPLPAPGSRRALDAAIKPSLINDGVGYDTNPDGPDAVDGR